MIEYVFLILFNTGGMISEGYAGDGNTMKSCQAIATADIHRMINDHPDDKIIFFGCVRRDLIERIEKINYARPDLSDRWDGSKNLSGKFRITQPTLHGTSWTGYMSLGPCLWRLRSQEETIGQGLYCATENAMTDMIDDLYREKWFEHRKYQKAIGH